MDLQLQSAEPPRKENGGINKKVILGTMLKK
jgi:hypothetical protein